MEAGKVARERVCVVAPVYPAVGGMRTMVRHLVRVLEERYAVMLLSVKFLEEEEQELLHYDIGLNHNVKLLFNPWNIPSIVLYQLSGALWCLALSVLGVKRFLVQEAINSAFFVTVVARITGARVFLFDYGPMLQLYDPRFVRAPSRFRRGLLTVIYVKLLRAMNRFSLRHCYKFFIYNNEMRRCALDHGLENEKEVFYSFPVDTTVFRSYGAGEREEVRERLGVRKGETVITFIGRVSADKGFPYLLESARVLVEKYAGRVRFVIVGDGPLVEWFLLSTVAYREEHMLYLGPVYDPGRTVEILNASDIFVYPITVSYGYALALLEAMAVGLPGIITDVGPTKEVIVNGGNGVVVPVGDAEALTGAIECLINDEELRKRMGENAQQVLTRFSTEAYRKTILNSIT